MKISSLDAEDILIDGTLPEYQRGMSFFFSELVELNVNIYISRQIMQFPLDLFRHRSRTIFFRMVVHNFFNASLLIITKLATDTANDLYTLTRFKNTIRKIVKPEYTESFQEYFKQTRFDRETKVLLDKAKQLRDKRIAHTSEALIDGTISESILDFAELESLCDSLNSLLNTLSFNVGNRFLPSHYLPDVQYPPGREQQPDIEEWLDSIAKDSELLNMPERSPAFWHERRQTLSEEELKQLNRYRKKFSLSQV